MKPYLRILVALSFCISQSAFGQDAIATGAGAPTNTGMTATTTDGATGATTSTVFGSGAIPGGLEEAAAAIKAGVASVAALPAQAATTSSQLTIPTLSVMQSSAAEYEATRVACYGAQATASTMCMESTNPNLISTVAAVNLGVAGLNSLAVNDACKGMSKIMTLAQAGMTGFLAVCGAMRLKCTMSCGTTSAALSKLSGATSGGATCIGVGTPFQIAEGTAACPGHLASYSAAVAKIKAALVQEANAADVTVRPVAAKVAICTKGYALMLASGAVSLMSIVNSMKQSKNCDKDSDGGGSSSSASTAAAATTTAAASTTGSSTTTGTTTETPETSSNLIVAPTTPAASATDTATSSQVRTASANQAAGAAGARGTLSSSGSSLSSSGASTELASTAVNEKTKEYQAYMPGGTKDPSRNIAGQSAYEKEVTAAGGKSNWSKTRDAYRNLKTLEDE